MKKNDFKKAFIGVLMLAFCFTMHVANAQEMYISTGSILHYMGGDFASGHIDNNNSGTFSIGTNFVADNENYVSGSVSVLAAGTYATSLEGFAEAREPSFTTTGAASITYNASAAPNGLAPSGYVLANAEIYTFTGNVSAGSATPLGSTTFGTADGAIIPVYSSSESGPWNAVAVAGTTTKMTFAKENSTFSAETFDSIDTNFILYPNPVTVNSSSIYFNLPSSVKHLSVVVYSVTGTEIQRYKSLLIKPGVNRIDKPNVAQGLYVIQFYFNHGEQKIIKRVLIE